jgi:ELWxxDGT repeat protein
VNFDPESLISSGAAIHYSGFNNCSTAPSDRCTFLYSSNGSGGILNVEDTQSNRVVELTVSNGIVYFSQNINGEPKIFHLNGGVRSAALSTESNPFVYPSNLFAAGGLLFFNAFTDGSFEVLVSDGTAAGTSLLKDFDSESFSTDLLGA